MRNLLAFYNRTAYQLIGLYTVFGLVLVAIDAKAEVYDLRNNPGGETVVFENKAKSLGKDDVVRIGGYCNSACNIIAMQWRYQVCAMPGAVLGFHMPFHGQWANAAQTEVIVKGGKAEAKWSRDTWRKEWLGRFNPKLNRILAVATANGLVPNPAEDGNANRLFTVRATDVLPTCKKGNDNGK